MLQVCHIGSSREHVKHHKLIRSTGSAAAAFQSWAYGGFTPAGGIFATLTSMGMLGILNPLVAILASLIATAVAVLVWKIGLGVA